MNPALKNCNLSSFISGMVNVLFQTLIDGKKGYINSADPDQTASEEAV